MNSGVGTSLRRDLLPTYKSANLPAGFTADPLQQPRAGDSVNCVRSTFGLWLGLACTFGACSPRTSSEGDDANDGASVCGNGVVEDGEQCDDGNDIDGDGCNTDCRISGARHWCIEYSGPSDINVSGVRTVAYRDALITGGRLSKDGQTAPWLLRLDPDGAQVWEKRWPLDQYLSLQDIAATDAEQIVLTGFQTGAGHQQAWVAVVSGDGEVVSENTLVSEPEGLAALTVLHQPNGVVIAGRAGLSGWLASLDANLEIIWEDRITIETSTRVTALARFADGRLAVGGVTEWPVEDGPNQPRTQGFLWIYDGEGGVQSERRFPADVGTWSWETTALQVVGDDLLVGGYRHSGPSSTGSLWRLTATGQFTESFLFESADGSAIRALAGAGGGIYTAGYFGAFPPLPAVCRFSEYDEPPIWTTVEASGTFVSLAPSAVEPAIYAGGWAPVDGGDGTEHRAFVCKYSQ
jgi:cysteine-rich repeat protein